VRPLHLTASLAALLAVGACGRPQAQVMAQETSRPDVFLIVVDTLRADRLQPYGCERPTSPTLQALAERGVVFEDVTAQGSWTKPSMVSLLQGHYLTAYRDILLEDSPTMAEQFRNEGYRTLALVANGLLNEKTDFDRGFERFHNVAQKDGKQSGNGREVLDRGTELLEQAYAREEDGTRPPVFAWFHFMEPHAPYERYPEYEAELPTDASMLGGRRERYRGLTGRDLGVGVWMKIAGDLAAYDQEVREADSLIEELLGEVDRLGDLDNTLIAVASDHGEGLWQHGAPPEDRTPLADGTQRMAPGRVLHGGHGKMLSVNLIATPLLLQGPGVPQGARISEPVANIDIFPTLLHLVGHQVPEHLDGRSLVAAMYGSAGPEAEPVYTRVQKERAIRDPDSSWRLVLPTEGYEDLREVRLHDVSSDPLETVNAAQTHPEVLARLEGLLEEFEARFPTETSFGRVRSEQERNDMAALGYTGDDG